jgi:organic hydroperoxide reductase OsmC/OhrA
MRDHIHRYRTELAWHGSTGGGYAAYDRTHRVDAPPGNVNPEQLLLAAASSCQLLSFLALVAREGIDVVSYEDSAEALMPDDDKPVRITRITLRPRVVVAPGAGERVRALLIRAHHDCFIANSIKAEIILEPEIRHADGSEELRIV